MGIVTEASFSGRPLGLSLTRTKKPLVSLVLKVRTAVNSIKASDCQEPGITSRPCPCKMRLDFESRSLIGKTPSNIQLLGSLPLMVSGLLIMELATGVMTCG